MSETAQVELKRGRVSAPAWKRSRAAAAPRRYSPSFRSRSASCFTSLAAAEQGLTLIHCSAQRKHFLWDTLAVRGASVTNTVQIEMLSGGVEGPAAARWNGTSYSTPCTSVSPAVG